VASEFAAWQSRLPEVANTADIWPRIVRLANELRALRKSEQDLIAAAQAGSNQTIDAEPELVNPVPLDTLFTTLLEPSAHARAVDALAREVEQRRIEVGTELLAERRRELVERVAMMGPERAAMGDRVALTQRKLHFLQQKLERLAGAQMDVVRQLAQRAAVIQGTPEAATIGELPALANEMERLLLRGNEVLAQADAQDIRLLELTQLWNDTRDRLAIEGATEALGLILVSDLARTLPPGQLARQLTELRRELAGLRLRLIDLRSRLVETRDPLPGLTSGELVQRARDHAGSDAPLLGSIHFRLLLSVEAANLAVAETLSAHEGALGELDQRNTALRDLIGKRLLWTPSHTPIGPAWFVAMGQRLRAGEVFTNARRQPAETLRSIHESLPGPGWLLALFAALGTAWWWLARQRRRLLSRVPREGESEFRRAIVVVLLSVLLALPWALITGLAFLLLRGNAPPSGFYESVISSPVPGFWTVLVLASLILLANARGAEGHVLGWEAGQCLALRRHAVALLALIVPSHVGVSAAWFRGDLGAIEYESRAVFMLAWLGVALVFWIALRPGGVWFGADSGRGSLGRRLLRLGLTSASLVAALAAARGLQITAAAIATEIEGSIGVLATLLVAHGLALRGIALGERRAAEWQAVAANLAQREGQAESHAAIASHVDAGTEAAGIDSRSMVGFVIGVGGAIWLALQWADMVPALWRLDEIVLWHATSTQGEISVREPISVLDLLFALIAAMLLAVGLRRLPSMAELLLRQRSSVDAGTRFAISAVLRYLIAFAGIVATLGLLGVRWSNLQWMAAALTVGLGFGLQEIFANFVSGLILLFERPVRVGDVVTVGEVTGTVANIGTRATTVVDFDHREVLIPNKALITDRLVNWTLSSEVTRITIKVGVGYDVDPELAHRLLQQAARENALVMERPPPQSVFVAFGASNLEFELRAFVARIDHRVPTTSDLHRRVLALFHAAGVDIDYDQLDVRLVGAVVPPSAAPPAAG
jgi:potassium efflux system protein